MLVTERQGITWRIIAPRGVELVAQPATPDIEAITGPGGVMYKTGEKTRIWQNGGAPRYLEQVVGSDGKVYWVYDSFPPGCDDSQVRAEQDERIKRGVMLYNARHD